MYKITIKNKNDDSETTIYQSNSLTKFIASPKLSLEWQQPGSLSFSMLPGHSSYGDISPIITFVYVYWDDEELFFGRVLTIDKDLSGKKDIYCEGALNFLKDGELQHGYDDTKTVSTFFLWLLGDMNTSVEPRKKFVLGEIDSDLGNIEAYFKTEDHANPKSTLDDLVVNRFGGCLVIKKETRPGTVAPSGHNLSYLKTVGTTRTELIRLGENVRDRADHESGESIFTVLRPFGANSEGTDSKPIELSTNGGIIEIPSMIEKYGRIYKSENFSDKKTESELLEAANDFIKRLGMKDDKLPKTCDIKYVDFHYLNPTIGRVGFGDVFTDIEGYPDQSMTVGHLELDLENPANDSMSLYNQTYLDAREYSEILNSSTNAGSNMSGSARSGGGSSIAKALGGITTAVEKKTDEVEQHFVHRINETNQSVSDAYGLIGVKIHPTTGMPEKDENGNYIWVEGGDTYTVVTPAAGDNPSSLGYYELVNGEYIVTSDTYARDGKTYYKKTTTPVPEIWGNFTRSAWETIIGNSMEVDGTVLALSQIQTTAHGDMIINAINQWNSGALTINANKIEINATNLINIKDPNGNPLFTVTTDDDGSYAVFNGTILASALTGEDINVSHLTAGDCVLDNIDVQAIYVHNCQYVVGEGVDEVDRSIGNVIYSLDGTSEGTGADKGKIFINYTKLDGTTGSINFNIAATQCYIDGVAARTANSISAISLSDYNTSSGYATVSVTANSNDNASVNLSGSVYAGDIYLAGVSTGESNVKNGLSIIIRRWTTSTSYYDTAMGNGSQITLGNGEVCRVLIRYGGNEYLAANCYIGAP